jgi:hypothetical protein
VRDHVNGLATGSVLHLPAFQQVFLAGNCPSLMSSIV